PGRGCRACVLGLPRRRGWGSRGEAFRKRILAVARRQQHADADGQAGRRAELLEPADQRELDPSLPAGTEAETQLAELLGAAGRPVVQASLLPDRLEPGRQPAPAVLDGEDVEPDVGWLEVRVTGPVDAEAGFGGEGEAPGAPPAGNDREEVGRVPLETDAVVRGGQAGAEAQGEGYGCIGRCEPKGGRQLPVAGVPAEAAGPGADAGGGRLEPHLIAERPERRAGCLEEDPSGAPGHADEPQLPE